MIVDDDDDEQEVVLGGNARYAWARRVVWMIKYLGTCPGIYKRVLRTLSLTPQWSPDFSSVSDYILLLALLNHGCDSVILREFQYIPQCNN